MGTLTWQHQLLQLETVLQLFQMAEFILLQFLLMVVDQPSHKPMVQSLLPTPFSVMMLRSPLMELLQLKNYSWMSHARTRMSLTFLYPILALKPPDIPLVISAMPERCPANLA